MKATTSIPWLPTTSEFQTVLPSLAEQVAAMLHAEHQVMIMITSRDGGRLGGFMAELTHSVSRGDSVLRIKSAIEADALHTLLAQQIRLPIQGLSPMQVAAKLGERLREAAPNGQFVLLCEAAHTYPGALLEALRQLGNYPLNIALSGRPSLLRRLRCAALRPLKQRLNYHLDLDEWSLRRGLMWLLLAVAIAALPFIAWRAYQASRPPAQAPRVLAGTPSSPQPIVHTLPRATPPSSVAPSAPPPAESPAPPEKKPPEHGVALTMDPELAKKPAR